MDISINFWAVLVSAVASMVMGSIWYGPLFGKKFMKEKGMDTWSTEKQAEMKKSITMTYIWQFIASLVMFYVLAHFIRLGMVYYPDVSALKAGIHTGLWVWVGFALPLALGEAIWGGKMTLFWINVGNMLVTLLVAGAIIGAWN
ncbi:MAG TPA: DUF1761 domain-containing protein [Candidatus Paceibacterota bacterium]